MSQNTFVIDSFPRTGSTSLARLLACHPDVGCLIEPFHPRRYGGEFHRMAMQAGSVKPALDLIRIRWTGIKHVWVPPEGFPFVENPKLNEEIMLYSDRVIFLQRRNLLQRYISNFISKQLDFWIGTKQEFRARLENAQLRELDPAVVLDQLQKEKAAIEHRLKFFEKNSTSVMHLFYEDLFGEGVDSDVQFRVTNLIFRFLGVHEVSENEYLRRMASFFDKKTYQWASTDVYTMIPRIREIEASLASQEFGRLF